MSNPNPLPPANAEIVAKWRADFESEFKGSNGDFKRGNSHFYGNDQYTNVATMWAWQGFLIARQSVLIELPKASPCQLVGQTHLVEQGINSVARSIEAQGYAVSRE